MIYPSLSVREKYSFPADLPLDYLPGAMLDVFQWLQEEGRNIILIYGELDPWTGGAIDIPGQGDVLKVIQPGSDHQVRTRDLDQKDLVLSKLLNWTGLDQSTLRSHPPSPPALSPTLDAAVGPLRMHDR